MFRGKVASWSRLLLEVSGGAGVGKMELGRDDAPESRQGLTLAARPCRHCQQRDVRPVQPFMLSDCTLNSGDPDLEDVFYAVPCC